MAQGILANVLETRIMNFYDIYNRGEAGVLECKRCGIRLSAAEKNDAHACKVETLHWKAPTHTTELDGNPWLWGTNVDRPYQKHRTNKWGSGFIDIYEVLFNHMKHMPITLLEFGVYYGASIYYFREFFTDPSAKIVGFDHHSTEFYGADHGCPHYFDFENNPNVFLEVGDQRNSEDVQRIIDAHGPFDVIIDDGHHNWPFPTEDLFYQIWPQVKEGGFYLIEDVEPGLTQHLLDEIVIKNQGKGFSLHSSWKTFGPRPGGGGAIVILQKTQNRIAGLDEVLVE
jgi:hypothetical protein